MHNQIVIAEHFRVAVAAATCIDFGKPVNIKPTHVATLPLG